VVDQADLVPGDGHRRRFAERREALARFGMRGERFREAALQ